jgi:predicted chitinase
MKLTAGLGLAALLVLGGACASEGGGNAGGAGGNQSSGGSSGGRGGSGGGNQGSGGSGTSAGGSGGSGTSAGGSGGSGTGGSGTGGSGGSGTSAGGSGGSGTGGSGTGGAGGSSPAACGAWKPGYTGPLLGRCNATAAGCMPGQCGTTVSKGGFLTFDDFEGAPIAWSAANSKAVGINWPARDGRTGNWTHASGVAPPSGVLETAATDTTGGSPGSKQALHYAGAASAWPTLLMPFGSGCYDASAYAGISFWMKGNPAAGTDKIKVNLHTPPNEPVASGGVCVDGCYNHYAKIVDVKPTWTKFTIPWSDFAQTYCAVMMPPIPQNFEPHKQILALSFSPTENMKGFDIWIDDIRFDLDPDSRDSFEKIVTQPLFDEFFKTPKAPASYQGLIAAVQKYGSKWGGPIAGEGTPTQRKHEAAAFLGQVTQETGSLIDLVEKVPTMPPFHGRGAIQLTGMANYAAAQAAGFAGIVANPDLIVGSADFLFGTAIWFWMTPQSGGAGVCHQAIMGGSFGQTTRIINGIECLNPTPATQLNRAKYYTEFAAAMGIAAHKTSLYCP